MRRSPLSSVTFAVLLVTATIMGVAAVGSATAVSSGGDTITLPTDIGLNSADSIAKYNRTGVVHTSVLDPRMNITIGREREDVGLGLAVNPLESGLRNDFIRITHREELSRTVRIPISAAYFEPFPRNGLVSVSGNTTASLEPVTLGGERYTMLTVTFDGRDSVVFSIPEDASASYQAVVRAENYTQNILGINIGLTPTPWNYLPPDAFAGNNTTAIRIEGNPGKMMVQYNAGTPDSPNWLPVPRGETSTSPVYIMEKEGVENAVYVVATTTDAPRIRVKEKTNLADKVSAWVRGATHIPDRIMDVFGVDLPEVNLF